MPNQLKNQKLIIKVLKGNKATRPPLWLMRQAGRHLPEYNKLRLQSKNFLDLCYSQDLCVDATLQPIKRYGFDAAILFSDILVVPDALGQHVQFIPGTGPVLQPISTVKEINELNINRLLQHLSPIYKAIEKSVLCLKDFPSKPALIGFVGAPWTLATYMVEGGSSRDHQKTRRWAYESPKEFNQLIDLLIDATSQHLLQQIESGVEVIQIFDSWAGVLSPLQFDRWVIEPTKKIIDRIKVKFPDLPVIGFPRGAGLLYKNFIEETGVDAVSIDSSVPLNWAVENLQKNVVVQGNLDNLALLVGGDLLEAEITNVLTAFSNGPFIFNLGHGVLPDTPISHVERLVERVHSEKNG
jgi:uroporphyrinogen decarboxylase